MIEIIHVIGLVVVCGVAIGLFMAAFAAAFVVGFELLMMFGSWVHRVVFFHGRGEWR